MYSWLIAVWRAPLVSYIYWYSSIRFDCTIQPVSSVVHDDHLSYAAAKQLIIPKLFNTPLAQFSSLKWDRGVISPIW